MKFLQQGPYDVERPKPLETMRAQLKTPFNPLEHHATMAVRGLRGGITGGRHAPLKSPMEKVPVFARTLLLDKHSVNNKLVYYLYKL